MLTHINRNGFARMVQITEKQETHRIAIARGKIRMAPETLMRIQNGGIKKGDVVGIAQVAGVMGAKRTSELIPMCHPLILTSVDLSFEFEKDIYMIITAEVQTYGRTGVEMEALHAVSTAALTIYDMCKAIDKNMCIESIELVYKVGGKSGEFKREEMGR